MVVDATAFLGANTLGGRIAMNSMRGWHLQSARTLPAIVVPLGLAALLGAAACTDTPESLGQREQAVISDAVHGPEASRVAGFYFLPPVVPRPAMRGAFVPEVSPTVQIDRIHPGRGGARCPGGP